MSIMLWILQFLLALLFVAAGATKLFQPYEGLARRMPWVEDYSPRTVRAVGGLELLGGLGLVLPALLGIAVVLTPLAAVGLAVIMVLATVHHLRRREIGPMVFTIVLLLLLLFLAWGRLGLAPL